MQSLQNSKLHGKSDLTDDEKTYNGPKETP